MQIISFVCAVGLLTSPITAAQITTSSKHIRSELLQTNKTLIYSKQVSSGPNASNASQNLSAPAALTNPIIRDPLPAKPNATHISNSYTEGQLTGYKAFLSHPNQNASVATHLYTEDKTFNRGVMRGYEAGMNHRASANASDVAAGVGSEQYMNGQLAGYRAALQQKVSNHARVSKQEFPASILQHDVVFNAGARAGFEAGANSQFSRAHPAHSAHHAKTGEKSDVSQKLVSHPAPTAEVSHQDATAKDAYNSSSVPNEAKAGDEHRIATVEHSSASVNQTQRIPTDDHMKVGKKSHKHKPHLPTSTPEESRKTQDEKDAQFFAGRQMGMDASTRSPNSQPSAYFTKDQTFNSGVQAGYEANAQSHHSQ